MASSLSIYESTVSEHKLRLHLPRGSARHRRGQSRDHRQGLDRRHLRQLRSQCHSRPLLLYARESDGEFKVEARDYDNKPVRTRAHVELLRWNWRDNTKGAVKAPRTWRRTPRDPARRTSDDSRGEGRQLTGCASRPRTPEGREVEDYSYLWVSGGSRRDFGSRTDTSIPDHSRQEDATRPAIRRDC